MKIIVIEDNDLTLKIIRTLFQSLQIDGSPVEVTSFKYCSDFLAKVHTSEIDLKECPLIITDNNMDNKQLEGAELIAQLRLMGHKGKIIGISATDERNPTTSGKEAENIMKEAGANLFLLKPVSRQHWIGGMETLFPEKSIRFVAPLVKTKPSKVEEEVQLPEKSRPLVLVGVEEEAQLSKEANSMNGGRVKRAHDDTEYDEAHTKKLKNGVSGLSYQEVAPVNILVEPKASESEVASVSTRSEVSPVTDEKKYYC